MHDGIGHMTPPGQAPPLGRYPLSLDRCPPGQVHPLWAGTPPGRHPPGRYTPGRYPPTMVNERAIRILLECILVIFCFELFLLIYSSVAYMNNCHILQFLKKNYNLRILCKSSCTWTKSYISSRKGGGGSYLKLTDSVQLNWGCNVHWLFLAHPYSANTINLSRYAIVHGVPWIQRVETAH